RRVTRPSGIVHVGPRSSRTKARDLATQAPESSPSGALLFRQVHPEELIGLVDALERACAYRLEGDVGAREQRPGRARHQDLAGAGRGRDPCGVVDRDASHVVVDTLDLADMDTGPDLELQ